MGKVEIVVANPFDENVEFAISIKNINKKKTDEMRDILRMTAKGKRKGKNRIMQDVEFKSTEIESLVPMFFTQQQSLHIKKHSATKLAVFYQPLTLEPHQAQIGRPNRSLHRRGHRRAAVRAEGHPQNADRGQAVAARDDGRDQGPVRLRGAEGEREPGERDQEVHRNVHGHQRPGHGAQAEGVGLTRFIVKKTNLDLKIFRNLDLYSAEGAFFSKNNSENQDALSPMKKNARKRLFQRKRNHLLNENSDPAQMTISLSPGGFLQGPELVELRDKVLGSPKKHMNGRSLKSSDGVVVSFLPQSKVPVKEMLIKMTLKNAYASDIRVYDLVLTVNPKVIKFNIEMETKAKVPKTQDLPLVNPNNFDVTIQPFFEMIEGERSNFTLSLNKIKLRKKSKEHFRIAYCSDWKNRSQAKLTFLNHQTNEKVVYKILGISNEPLSQGVLYENSNIGETKTLKVPLENSTGKILEYAVDCEIPGAKYEAKVSLKPMSKVDFPIAFSKSTSGKFAYKVKFITKDRKYIWYVINIVVEGSNIIEVAEAVCTTVRWGSPGRRRPSSWTCRTGTTSRTSTR